ncbi:MAG TPA: carbohydrate ABC transporter permease [Rectinemataceae bacterium]
MKKNTAGARIFRGIKTLFLLLFMALYLIPFLLVVLNSFKSYDQIVSNPLALPKSIDFSNYKMAAAKMKYPFAFMNTLVISIFSIVGITLFSSMAAHLFARKRWRLNKLMFFLMVGSIYIPFQAVMIPLLKIYSSIHFLSSKLSLIYMYLGFGSNMAVFLYSGFIKGIPLEMEEAAVIDGASPYQRFFQIVFPMLIPITVTIVILDVLWIWNDYLLPSLVLMSAKDRTLQLSTFYFYGTYSADYNLILAALVLTMIPVITIFLLLQKFVMRGITQGALK